MAPIRAAAAGGLRHRVAGVHLLLRIRAQLPLFAPRIGSSASPQPVFFFMVYLTEIALVVLLTTNWWKSIVVEPGVIQDVLQTYRRTAT